MRPTKENFLHLGFELKRINEKYGRHYYVADCLFCGVYPEKMVIEYTPSTGEAYVQVLIPDGGGVKSVVSTVLNNHDEIVAMLNVLKVTIQKIEDAEVLQEKARPGKIKIG